MHTDFWYDFGDGTGGDVIDLCALLEHGGDRRAAIHTLADRTGVSIAPSRDWVGATRSLNGLIQLWHENLTREARDYLHDRHITDQTITALKIGSTGSGEPADGYARNRISIPYFKNGYVYSYVARGDGPKYLKRRNDDLSDAAAPWGMHTLDRTDKPLILAEGAFDALSVWQEGYPVLSPMGGHFSRDQLATVLSAAQNFPHTVLAFDADNAGRQFAETLSRIFFEHRLPFRVARVPAPHKDISDYYTAGGCLCDLFDAAEDGPTHLFCSTTDKDAFKQLAHRAARHLDAPELAALFSAVRLVRHFEPEWLAALQKQCEHAPSEDTVARAVVRTHTLKYVENVGFYEYLRGAWRRADDTRIQACIGDALGRWRTGSRLSSILKIIRTEVKTDQQFDRRPLFNFVNGTLELSDPPAFREHRPEDFCSIQVPYPYIPDATSRDWERFVDDISGDDPKRAALLQEIAGYVLFPDCSLEQLFVLQGAGGNGKSVFLNLLTEVYGRENVSAVTVTGLCEAFQRIYLSQSLLNIAPEIKSNLSGAEEYLKQIASGELISACYKGKDFVQFKPRCKLMFATNGQLKSGDTSDGLMRRMKIVNFTQSFVEYPQLPNERRRDTELQARLAQQLPAIFNWCLEGYLLLRRARSFTEVEDEAQARRDFAEASNPIITFLREENIVSEGRVSKADLRDRWKRWAEENGHHAGSSTRLYREVRRLFPYGTKEVDTCVNGVHFKGFVFPSDLNSDELL